MKNQVLFFLKDKSKKLKCHLLQFLFDTLRVKVFRYTLMFFPHFHERDCLFVSLDNETLQQDLSTYRIAHLIALPIT